jgi:nucleoside-diphosphate-sugar epimerase
VYNLGTNGQTAVTIADLVSMIRDLVGMEQPIVFQQQFDSGDDARWSSGNKAWRGLGWEGKTELHEGLRKTIEWYIQNE